MNWEAIGAISEAIGVVAIFVSLVYVAIQIRQNTEQVSRSIEAAQLEAFERNIQSGNRIRELLILHPELAELLEKGYASFAELNRAEKVRFGLLLRNVFSEMQGAYVRQLSVRHDPLEFKGIARIVDEVLSQPGVREWLARNQPDWRPAFHEFVEERLAVIRERPDVPDPE